MKETRMKWTPALNAKFFKMVDDKIPRQIIAYEFDMTLPSVKTKIWSSGRKIDPVGEHRPLGDKNMIHKNGRRVNYGI